MHTRETTTFTLQTTAFGNWHTGSHAVGFRARSLLLLYTTKRPVRSYDTDKFRHSFTDSSNSVTLLVPARPEISTFSKIWGITMQN